MTREQVTGQGLQPPREGQGASWRVLHGALGSERGLNVGEPEDTGRPGASVYAVTFL